MTDEAKALVERLEEWEWTLRAAYKGGDLGTDEPALLMGEAADLIETQAREIERLREALEAYAARCTICSGGGSIVEEDSATGALLWRDCPGCTPARAALAGESHD